MTQAAREALARLDEHITKSGADDPCVERDIAAIRLALGQRGGDPAKLRAGMLRVASLAFDLYMREEDGRFVATHLDDMLKAAHAGDLFDAEDKRRLIVAYERRNQ